MEAVTTLFLLVVGVPLGLFAFYQIFWLALSVYALLRRRSVPLPGPATTRFGVLIPAHNEELLIGDVLASLERQRYPCELFDVIVIADNCDDATAQIARRAGATCLERRDTERRGKPYALDWALSQLDLNRYDAFCILDADTLADPAFLAAMDAELQRGHKALQGEIGVMNPDENWLTRLAIVPSGIKFKLHFPGKNLVGHSCPLAGNGMCFDAEIFRRFGWKAYSLAENWEYHALLSEHGYQVSSVNAARVYGQVTNTLKTARNQRVRWLKGRLETLQRYWRPLLQGGLRGDLAKLDTLIEIVRPSYSMLLLWSGFYWLLCAALALAGVIGTPWWAYASAVLGAQVFYFLAALVVQRAPLRTWLSLFMVPPYLAWKLALSVSGVLSLKDKHWIRTARHKVG